MRLPRLAALVTIPLVVAACAGGDPATAPHVQDYISALRVSSSRLILHGRVRCMASLRSPVQPGGELGLTFSLHNDTGSTVHIRFSASDLWFVVKASDGTVYDTRVPFERARGPVPRPLALRAGATVTMPRSVLRVRWNGPLRITPGCEDARLPVLPVRVATNGAPPDGRTAVADVVAAAGHLLDHCRPERPGVAAIGRIYPPSGNASPLPARCSVALQRERGFWLAQVLLVSPPGRKGVTVGPYERLSLTNEARPYEAIAWELVVTRDGATTVDGAERDASRPANRMAPDWTWTGSHWQGPGGSRCGGETYAGLYVAFISVCPS